MKRLLTMAGLFLALVALHPGLGATQAEQKDEGIHVHGHWVMDVRNPDGTLAVHREFDNALGDARGPVAVLARMWTAGRAEIRLLGEVCSTRYGSSQLARDCYILMKEDPTFGPSDDTHKFPTLVRRVDSNGSMALTGDATASFSGAVTEVKTVLQVCVEPAISPEACTSGPEASGIFLTQTALTPPQPVVAGQSIQVTVTITFS
jgi:hypothetical protein